MVVLIEILIKSEQIRNLWIYYSWNKVEVNWDDIYQDCDWKYESSDSIIFDQHFSQRSNLFIRCSFH